jgi:hypothetical protein
VDNAGGDNGTSTRLERLESDLAAIKEKVVNLETEIATVKNGHIVISKQLTEMNGKMDKVVMIADGTDKVLGFCRKNWKTILKFGCGFVTAYGISNPQVQRTLIFVQHFFGL